MGRLLTLLRRKGRFSPLDLPDLALWLDASDESTITHSGGAISEWRDKSGNDRHATQATAALQPALASNVLNFLPAVGFDSDYMAAPALGDTTNLTVLVAAKHRTTAGTSKILVGASDGGYASARPWVSVRSASGQPQAIINTSAETSAVEPGATDIYPHVFELGFSEGVALDGALDGNVESVATAINLLGLSGPVDLGAGNNSGTVMMFAVSDIGEVIICADYLGGGDRLAARKYLLKKWIGFLPSATRTPIAEDTTRHEAFPGFVVASNGDYIATYRDGPNHTTSRSLTLEDRGVIRQQVSTDGGATWGASAIIVDEGYDDARDSALTRLANGNLLLAYFVAPVGETQIYVRISTDDGASWGDAIAPNHGYATAATSAPIVELTNGDLLFPFYRVTGGMSALVRSTDGGATWGNTVVIAEQVTDELYLEPNIVQLRNGDLLCVIRGQHNGAYYKSVSSDNGATWSSLEELWVASAGPPSVGLLSDGTVVVIYRSGGARFRWSRDNGATWSDERPFDVTNSYADAQLQEIASGVFGAVHAVETSSTVSNVYYRTLIEQ